jgi:hypothetical protein
VVLLKLVQTGIHPQGVTLGGELALDPCHLLAKGMEIVLAGLGLGGEEGTALEGQSIQ